MTLRGWWFLFVVAVVTWTGVLWFGRWSVSIPLLGLALSVWFATEWVLFQHRFLNAADQLRVDRTLMQGGRVVPSVWVGAPFTVRLTVTSTGSSRLPFVVITDRLPADFSLEDDANQRDFALLPGEPVVLEYTLKADAPGVLRFEGVTVRVADLAGFFYRRIFLRLPESFLILPPLTDEEGRQRTHKRFNTLPPPGVHRLRRPGSGDELLDLREYRPGDPPKMIAWKPSARRDKIIVKEIESDVPVRCVLFLDASNGARVGMPGQTPVIRHVEIGAAIAQAATANRDLVGLTIFDEKTADVLKPARTKLHIIQMLRKFTHAAAELPDPLQTDADLLARYSHPIAQELYPDLLRREINSRPLGLFWLPIVDSRWLWLMMALLLAPLLFAFRGVLETMANIASIFAPSGKTWMLMAAFAVLPGVLAWSVWLVHGIRGMLPPRAGRTSRRKQLCALFAVLDDAGPAAIERLRNDDVAFAKRTTAFLQHHQTRLPLVMFDRDGAYRFRNPEKVVILANALTQSVGRARDNELYIILADLLELGVDIQPLVNAAKVARARHHQVLVILPWPPDVPAPNAQAPKATQDDAKIATVVQSVLIARYHRNFAALRSALAKAGATVVRVDSGDPVRLVLERLDQLRGARIRR